MSILSRRIVSLEESYKPVIDWLSEGLIEYASSQFDKYIEKKISKKQLLADIQKKYISIKEYIDIMRHADHTFLDQYIYEEIELDSANEMIKEVIYETKESALRKTANPFKSKKIFYDSSLFYNFTMTGKTERGQIFHIRFGTHGAMDYRQQTPNTHGFPFIGSKWVEGDIVIGNKLYSFVSNYTENIKVYFNDNGQPINIVFQGRAKVKNLKLIPLPADKWNAGLPENQAVEEVNLSLNIPVRSSAVSTSPYILFNMGYIDKNYFMQAKDQPLFIIEHDGQEETILLNPKSLHGNMEEGQYKNIPKFLKVAYNFVQGQQIELANFESLEKLEQAVAQGDMSIIQNMLPADNKKYTSTQFSGKILANKIFAALANFFLSRRIDESGSRNPDGSFTSYESKLFEKWRKNKDYIYPLAVLNVNYVPLYQKKGNEFVRSLLERRTVLLYDTKKKAILLGFQEVFHRYYPDTQDPLVESY